MAANRAELDDLRESNRKLTASHAATMQLLKTMAQQLNTNTVVMKRWHEGSPSLQAIEKAHAVGGRRNKPRILLPPTADLRMVLPSD